MNWFQKFLLKAAAPKMMRLTPQFMRWAFETFDWYKGVDGYQKNSAVFACVSALAFSFPEPPLLAGTEKDGKFTASYDDQLMDFIQQPNPDMGEAEFMQYCVVYAAIGGEALIWKQRNVNGRVIAWWPFSIAQITALPGETTEQGFVKEYEYDAGDGNKITLPKDDVIQWKWMPNPKRPWRGMGGIEAAAQEVDKDDEANSYIYSLLKNNAVPPIVITLTEGDELTADRASRLRKEWVQAHTGENAGTPAFLEAGMTVEKLGFDLQQLAGEALSGVPEARIAACLRVPPVVAGLSVGLKRSDYGDQAARRAFTELTLAALWRNFASELQNGMRNEAPVKPKNWRLQFNLAVVRALLDDESKRWERITSAFERSLLTRAEAKQQLGIEAKAGDDVYKVSLASEFVPVGEDVRRDVATGSTSDAAKATPSPRPSPNATPQKSAGQATAFGEGSQEKRRNVAAGLRKLRVRLAGKMEGALEVYFEALADSVVERARGMKAGVLPEPEGLVTNEDQARLTGLVKRFYVTILEASWETWNLELGVVKAFDLADPLVTEVLAGAGTQVKDITETTLEALRSSWKFASEQGWSVDEWVKGDPEAGVRGLRDIVTEIYKDRPRTIARTELGNAQNEAAAKRYGAAGVEKVEILDNGSDDDDEECKVANGQIWSLAYFMEHTLEHPNCTRAAAAYFGDGTPDRE
jgi:HK97 family phage portal protein